MRLLDDLGGFDNPSKQAIKKVNSKYINKIFGICKKKPYKHSGSLSYIKYRIPPLVKLDISRHNAIVFKSVDLGQPRSA